MISRYHLVSDERKAQINARAKAAWMIFLLFCVAFQVEAFVIFRSIERGDTSAATLFYLISSFAALKLALLVSSVSNCVMWFLMTFDVV